MVSGGVLTAVHPINQNQGASPGRNDPVRRDLLSASFVIEIVQALDAGHAQDIARAQHPTRSLSAVAAELLDGQDRHKLLAAWLRGRTERGRFTTGCLLKAHPNRLLFLVEISEAPNASSLVPLTPIPAAFVWGLLGNGG